jgi:MFS family permease
MASDPSLSTPVPDLPEAVRELRLLAHRGVVPAIGGRTLSSLASQMQAVILGWQIYALTGSAFSLGLIGLAQFLPVLALIFVAGEVVDRGDRRAIAAICQALQAVAAAVLAVASFRGAASPAMIYAVVAASGAARAFEAPARQAMLPALVPAALFPQAAALSSSLFQTATILGPSAGGLLYGVGADVAYAACAVSYVAAAVMTWLVPALRRAVPIDKPSLATFFGGITFIRARPDILGAISLDLFAVLLGGATALLPVYARDILHAGPVGLGLLRAAPAVGALAVSAWLARRPMRRGLGARMFGAVALFGVGTIIFGVSRNMAVSVAALALLGGADVVSVVIRSTLVQIRTPDEMRGRVGAVNMLFIGSSNQLGEFESGTLAGLVGAVPAVVLGGVGTLVVAGIWMWAFPGLRRLDRVEGG